MKKCFTINPFRATSEFVSFKELLSSGEYQGIEIFYPYMLTQEGINTYYQNVINLQKHNPEMVLHLPHGPNNDLCNLDQFENIIDRMKKAIDFGSKLNVGKYTLHLGYMKELDREMLINHITKALTELCDYAGKALVMIENMPGKGELGYSPKEIENIILKTNKPNLKFILDTGHAHLSEYDNIQYIDLLFPYLSHIHLSDNSGIKDDHGPLGTGTISFDKIFSRLKDYQGLFCLEIIYQNPDDLLEYSNTLSGYFR